MITKTEGDDRLGQYILGGLDERERERIEAEYFEDDDAFEQMLIAEEELTDAYVRGKLSAQERARFEKSYMASQRGCERVRFARSLAGAVSAARRDEPTPETAVAARRPLFAFAQARGAGWRFAFAAVALVAAVSLTWLLVERARMRDELRQLRAEQAALAEKSRETEQRAAAEQARNGELLAQLEGERARPAQEAAREADAGLQDRASKERAAGQTPRASVVSFVLTPGLVRGGDTRTLPVPVGASSVALRLNVEADSYKSYRAVIETADGEKVWSEDVQKPRGSNGAGATIALPAIRARLLPPGDYILSLNGKREDGSFEGAHDYSFRVVRR